MIEKHNHNDKKRYRIFHDKKQLVKKSRVKPEFHLYLSINKWFSNDKLYYKIDYVLDNKIANLIPNKKINTNSIIYNKFKICNDVGELNIYQVPQIRPFEFTSSLDYKVVSTVLEVGLDEKVNWFEKLFTEKKLYIKNDSNIIEQFNLGTKELESVDDIISNIFSSLSIHNCKNNDN